MIWIINLFKESVVKGKDIFGNINMLKGKRNKGIK